MSRLATIHPPNPACRWPTPSEQGFLHDSASNPHGLPPSGSEPVQLGGNYRCSLENCNDNGPRICGIVRDGTGTGIAHGSGGGQRHVALTPGGDVYACSHARQPEFRLGNLLTDRLAGLWSSGPGRLARDRYRAACQGVTCPCSRGLPEQ